MNVPTPSDFMENFSKQKIPKSKMEIWAEKTRKTKPKKSLPPEEIEKIVGEVKVDVQEKFNKLAAYVQRKLVEGGMELGEWKVWYEMQEVEHQGKKMFTPKLRMHKLSEITFKENIIIQKVLDELDRIPLPTLMQILGIQI